MELLVMVGKMVLMEEMVMQSIMQVMTLKSYLAMTMQKEMGMH